MKIRPVRQHELPLMEEFLYLAIFQRDENNLLPRKIIFEPSLAIYFEGWGKPGDYCLAAEDDGVIAGMAWTRILNGKIKGFGNIDDDTPEFAISVLKEYRGKGIGTALMKEMLGLLGREGYPKASLAVQKDNYAVNLYKAVGFKTVSETAEEYIMVCEVCDIDQI